MSKYSLQFQFSPIFFYQCMNPICCVTFCQVPRKLKITPVDSECWVHALSHLDAAIEGVGGPVGDPEVGLVGDQLDGDAGKEAQGPVAHRDGVEQVRVRLCIVMYKENDF